LAKSAKPDFRALLKEHKPVFNAWTGLGSPLCVEIAADAGWHSVLIDQQHGAGGPSELQACLTAAKAAGVPAMVRVAQLDYGLIGRALDAGAQGVMVPMIETPEDAARLVHYTKYPPLGGRSLGPYRARFLVEGDYFAAANSWTIACAQIETARAAGNIDAICATPGFDMICIGPNDLAISLSRGQDRNIKSPKMLETIEHIRARAAAHGVITFIYAGDRDYAKHMIATGWQVITINSDVHWIAAAARDLLASIRP
jgi:4-hydroxy-2-oxoheptanedioate aldolase